MADRPALIPLAVRIALRNAVGGWGPFTVGQIIDLFQSHEFTERDVNIEDVAGERRTAAESFQARIDWTSAEQAQRYLDLVADVLDHYPEADDEPGSPGRALRRALTQGGFFAADGRLLLPRRPATVEPDVEGIWIPDRPRVFFSHVSRVREAVSETATALEGLYCSSFVAHVQIEPSRDWQDTIEAALKTCDVLVAWVTPDFPDSAWTDQEVGWVLGRGVPVIPMNADMQPYGFFGARQSLRVLQQLPWTNALNILRTFATPALRANPPPGSVDSSLVARTIVRMFCASPSFNSTRNRFPLLELIPPHLWSADMLEELDAATEFNRQINDAGLNDPPRRAEEAVRDLIRRARRSRRP